MAIFWNCISLNMGKFMYIHFSIIKRLLILQDRQRQDLKKFAPERKSTAVSGSVQNNSNASERRVTRYTRAQRAYNTIYRFTKLKQKLGANRVPFLLPSQA